MEFDEPQDEAFSSDHSLSFLSLSRSSSASSAKTGPGRNKTISTLILSELRSQKSGKPLKLEYLRAFFVRYVKKLVRFLSQRKNVKLFKHPSRQVRQDLTEAIISQIDLLQGDASTGSDPSNDRSTPSFKASYIKKHFSNDAMRELHDTVVGMMFEGNRADNIKEFLQIEVSSDNEEFSLHKFKLLLLSDYFKGDNKAEQALRSQIESFEMPRIENLEIGESQQSTQIESSIDSEYNYLERIY
mmetsp:Transcript_18396/g.33089  ORF Transcript_18396/g.33089 Transcript_18396/m.33089 type:complete len:243 (-) Transcript_18396:38-766(-)